MSAVPKERVFGATIRAPRGGAAMVTPWERTYHFGPLAQLG